MFDLYFRMLLCFRMLAPSLSETDHMVYVHRANDREYPSFDVDIPVLKQETNFIRIENNDIVLLSQLRKRLRQFCRICLLRHRKLFHLARRTIFMYFVWAVVGWQHVFVFGWVIKQINPFTTNRAVRCYSNRVERWSWKVNSFPRSLISRESCSYFSCKQNIMARREWYCMYW